MPVIDPRDIAADAKDQLRAFDIAITKVFNQGVKKLQKAGRKSHKKLADIHWVEAHVDVEGRVRPLGQISSKWVKRKLALGKEAARGRFTKGLFRTIKSNKSFAKTKTGFVIDLKKPNLTVTVPRFIPASERKFKLSKEARKARGSGSKRVAINDYIDHYEEQKAPGLGNIPARDLVRMNKETVDFLNERFQRVAKSASLAGKQRVVEVKLIFKGFKI